MALGVGWRSRCSLETFKDFLNSAALSLRKARNVYEPYVLVILIKLAMKWQFIKMAGAEGFEPTHAGTKNRCLTTWLRPNREEMILFTNLTKMSSFFIVFLDL